MERLHKIMETVRECVRDDMLPYINSAILEGDAQTAWAYILNLCGYFPPEYSKTAREIAAEANTHTPLGIRLHKNGKVQSICEYSGGLRHGTQHEYDKNGALIVDCGFNNGNLSGLYLRFIGGKLVCELNF